MGGAELPEELWTQILKVGIQNSKLSFKDVCCISITCRRLHRLSSEDSLWSHLLSSDFPSSTSSSSSPAKSTYRLRYDKERERRALAHRRAVLRKESEVFVHQTKLRDIQNALSLETDNMTTSAAQLADFLKLRQASVALNVWQPEVVRGSQRQIVEQCVVPVESRLHSLQMELKLCKQQLASLNKAYRDEKLRLDKAKQGLASLKYHPLHDFELTTSRENECNKKKKRKLKKLD